MKTKNTAKIDLILKISERYNLNTELIKTKKQLAKTVKEKRALEEQLALEYEHKEFFIIRLWNWIINFWTNLFSKRHNPIKDLNKHFSSRYKIAVEQYAQGFLTSSDLETLISYEKTVNATIQILEKENEEKRKKETYFAILKSDNSRLIEFLEKAKADKLVFEEEILKTKRIEVFDADALKSKQNKIKRLEGRIEKIDKEILTIQSAIDKEKQKNKRPVGRPKGTTKTKAPKTTKKTTDVKKTQEADENDSEENISEK